MPTIFDHGQRQYLEHSDFRIKELGRQMSIIQAVTKNFDADEDKAYFMDDVKAEVLRSIPNTPSMSHTSLRDAVIDAIRTVAATKKWQNEDDKGYSDAIAVKI